MSSTFRFLDLPNELRLKMYRFMLPREERIYLDQEELQFPIPYVPEESYGSTLNLLQVCKQIHGEATEFIYTQNTVNIIKPTAAEDFLDSLGHTACQYICKLECHVENGLSDLGGIWQTLKKCPRLTDLRLVFYHELVNWSQTLAQLAIYKLGKSDDRQYSLDIELHRSIWCPPYPVSYYAEQFDTHMGDAWRHAMIYTWDLPVQLRRITIAASVSRSAAQGLLGWQDGSATWKFQRAGGSDTEMKKTLRIEELI